MWHEWGSFMTTGHGWGLLWTALLVVATVAAAIAVTRALLPNSDARKSDPDEDSALETLRNRYARGEIDEDEFLARRDTLTRSTGGRR